MKLSGPWCRKGEGYVVGAGDYSHDRFGQEEVHAEEQCRVYKAHANPRAKF